MNMNPETRAIVLEELSAVLIKHYEAYIRKGSNPDAVAAWAIMQDARKHLGLSVSPA